MTWSNLVGSKIVFQFLGVIFLTAGAISIVVCSFAQDRLFEKWKAKEHKLVAEGSRGFGARLIKENNPPNEFEEAFNNRLRKKYGWTGYLSLVGIAFIFLSGI